MRSCASLALSLLEIAHCVGVAWSFSLSLHPHPRRTTISSLLPWRGQRPRRIIDHGRSSYYGSLKAELGGSSSSSTPDIDDSTQGQTGQEIVDRNDDIIEPTTTTLVVVVNDINSINRAGVEDASSPTISDNNAYAATAAATELRPPSDWVSLWKMRLITREDPFSIHKIACLIHTISSFAILGVAAFQFGIGQFDVVPPYLESITYVCFVSTTIMSLASVRMAFLHRKFDLIARNGFLGIVASTLFSTYFMLWTSPFAVATFFDDIWINRACFGILTLFNAYFVLDTVSKLDEIVEDRRDKKATDYQGRSIVDAILYVLIPVFPPLFLVALTAYIQAVLHDHPWYVAQCQYIFETTGFPFEANGFYMQVLGAMAPAYGALFVTLRDKKLISKTAEVTGISIFAVPQLVWAVYLGYVFVSSMV